MNEKITFDTLPAAVMELTEKVDSLISMFSTKIEKREEIPKYMNTERALEYLKKTGFPISKSKLYKLTALNDIPVYKEGNSLLFTKQELDKWCEEKVQTRTIRDNNFKVITKNALNKGYKNKNYGKSSRRM